LYVNEKCEVYSNTCADVKPYKTAEVNFSNFLKLLKQIILITNFFILKIKFQGLITIRDGFMVIFNRTQLLCSKYKRNELGIILTVGIGIKCDEGKEVSNNL
jgi:hypothetical protein